MESTIAMIELIDPIMQMGDSLLLFLEQSIREIHHIPGTILDAYDPKPGSTAGTNIWRMAYQSAKNVTSLAFRPVKKVTNLASLPVKYITHPVADLIGDIRKNTTSPQDKYYPQTTSELEKFADKYF
jgi:hypothetical protein